MEKPVTILLADDHTIVRQGLAKLLEMETDLRVVGEASDGREAVEKAEALNPDVVLMDIGMPQLNGIDAARRIKKKQPRTRIIILSMHSQEHFIAEALDLGASGFLLKNSNGSEIVRAVRAAMDGDTFLSPAVSRHVVERYLLMKKGQGSQEDLYGTLSNREREVFQMIGEGRSVKEISQILCVSVSTVKTHRTNIMDKLRVENISQLIHFAIRLGLVEMNL